MGSFHISTRPSGLIERKDIALKLDGIIARGIKQDQRQMGQDLHIISLVIELHN